MTDQLPPFTPSREMPSYTPTQVVQPPSLPASAYKFGSAASYAGPRTSKATATWALVLGVIPIPLGNLVAIGMGVSVLSRGRDGRNHGQARAIVGMVLATLWLLLFVGGAVLLAGSADRDASGAVTQLGDVQSTAVKVGDCLPAGVAEDKVSYTVAVTPCSEPHAAEVYADFELAAGRFPGDSQMTRLAEGGCVKRFQPFVGVRYGKSALDVTFLHPVRASWGQDRVVTCMLGANTPVTGTLKGSRR